MEKISITTVIIIIIPIMFHVKKLLTQSFKNIEQPKNNSLYKRIMYFIH
jgi:hypothetical protein